MAEEQNDKNQKSADVEENAQQEQTEEQQASQEQESEQTPPPVTEPTPQDRQESAQHSAHRVDSHRDVGIEYENDVNNMKAKLDKQPKVKFFCPLSPGEPNGSTEIVQINGFKMTIRKGQFVNVPEQVADILAEHYGLESPIEQQHNLDYQDEDTQNALR